MQTSSFWYLLLMSLLLAEGAIVVRYAPAAWRSLWQTALGGRRQAVDGLRGILASSVFVHHCVTTRAHLVSGGWDSPIPLFFAQMGVAPVTMFFFITGYLFWKKLSGQGKISFSGFIQERILRLGPAYWAACALFFLLVGASSNFALHVSPRLLSFQILGWLSFLGAGHDLNAIPASTRLLGQVWTLRLEWMFYFSLPFLWWFARKQVRLIGLVTGACILSYIADHSNAHPAALQFLWKTLGGYCGFLSATFGVGMMVATIPERASLRALAQSRPATLFATLLVLGTVFFVPARYGWMESLALAVPFFLVCFGNTFFGLLESPAALLLGTVSYSFYLLHSLAIHVGSGLLRRSLQIDSNINGGYWAACAVVATASLLVSCAAWTYLERPFVTRKRRITLPDQLATFDTPGPSVVARPPATGATLMGAPIPTPE